MGNNNSTQNNNTRGGGGQEENDDTSSLEGAFSQGGGSSHHSTYEHGPVTQTVPIPGAQSSHLNNITGGGFGGGRGGGGGGEALEPALVPVAITCASCFSPRSSEFSMRRSFYRSRRLPRRPLRQGGGGVFTLDVSFVFASDTDDALWPKAVFQKEAFTLVLNSSRVIFTHALAFFSLCVCVCVYPSRIFKTNRDARRFGRGSRRLLRRMANTDAAPSVWE